MTFVHCEPHAKLQQHDLASFFKAGNRYYSQNGKAYPSITSVLGADPKKKQSLLEWRKRVGEKEANKISRKASRRGTAIHQICENYLNNDNDYVGESMPDSIAMFNSLKPILDEKLGAIHAQEVALCSRHLGVAGRVDCIAEWDGVLSVIDFKTSSKPKKKEWISDYFMQCSGYAAMYYEMTGVPIKDVVVAIMVENEEPQIFKSRVGEWLIPLKEAIDKFQKLHVF